ncbi:TrmB family transcriptional regulator [Bacillus cytotoxicus]|uniref:TrmB family transcriptional regulator n=1 Tax=Bacillus cereus group sp. BfR-BA-01492 TaxID=2920361 RepID=UPI001F59B6A3|nr:TrmB family transcriptional regulator [Bacillus cereus group sp. BfR-BA-01492]EMA6343173.1 TrmB family transcriptional regulator [Bacillus cytotoxicus]
MEDLLQKIQTLGLNQYETKAYVSLVKHGTSSAYQVSKNSGVPRARIYEILDSLEQKGIVMREEVNEAVEYSPLPVDVFLETIREKWEKTYTYVEQELKVFEKKEPETDPKVTTLKGEENILAFCKILIRRAEKKIIISIWDTMYEKLLIELQKKEPECSVKGIVFQVEKPLRGLEMHRKTSYVENIGEHKWFIISIDGKEMVYGHSIEKRGHAFYTDDPVHVYLLENYIWHDILVNRLVREADQNIDSWIAPERDRFFSL